ncbi:MAG: histidine--tRNA ligase [Eggerthellaceae bacterium]|nr:histidine--tRNA ligase [Eggerthellaceae bacterium]
MAIKRAEGTKDLLASEALFWTKFRQIAFDLFARYGYSPIETPVFEKTELFVRGIGEATDVVTKEMFTVVSGGNLAKLIAGEHVRSDSRFSLRPEGTAGVVRAIAQNGLLQEGGAPVKVAYAGPMFRAERPQNGRQRQFNQVGIECLGADDPSIDAEGIVMLMRFFEAIGIPQDKMTLLVNTLGDAECRPAYRDALKGYILDHAGELCEDCQRRAETNPLRALDCKEEACTRVMSGAPRIGDFLCDSCKAHYAQVKSYLDAAGVAYVEDPTLVRGLDYYTRTVFEVQVSVGMDNNQNAIGGGGRYDKLMAEIGGNDTPGFGWALGYERCKIVLEALGTQMLEPEPPALYFACVDADQRALAFRLAQQCRDAGIACEFDHQGRSLKAQFKQADKLGCAQVAVLGPDEVAAGVVKLRDMATHEEREVPLEGFAENLSHVI